MSRKEIVTAILWRYGCSSSKEIANLALRDFNEFMTPAQAAGSIRPLIAAGKAASSKDASGRTKYWVNKNAANWDEQELNSLKSIMWKD